ncbi:hypothetical protein BU24DRAFT_391174 [Aaosphaeria arxii CBS 175.79]|uniref:F-box domain-containing protein n=1 Tax=Aaosphaeria arxii CBS 175.79 TaxID=1450172 RepID=A0A6A5XSZ6_9PLEO|nr:uncharacterized protein BU24DRAFT_391174 [Aaosphaeria arxii CBS 175.79]KAF2015871.1 hypothetical protein BU24DRAFT_391174 [Aaosphaeria arxii CBS 175.79]
MPLLSEESAPSNASTSQIPRRLDDPIPMPTRSGDFTVSTKSPRRSDGLRHALLRHPRLDITSRDQSPPKEKPNRRRTTSSSTTYSKRRVAFNKVINSIFPNNPPSTPHLGRQDSLEKCTHLAKSSPSDSLRSLDVVSPGTFLFSGPSLKSACSDSVRSNRSRLPSWAESSVGTNSPGRRQSSMSGPNGRSNAMSDSIMEPLVEHGVTRTMSDVLLTDDAHNCETMPFTSESNIQYSLQQANSSLKAVIHAKSPSQLSISHKLPIEILHMIYKWLHPRDFNAARHTCSTWMRASLDATLLSIMLKRNGYRSASVVDQCQRIAQLQGLTSLTGVDSEWTLSRYLSRECALSAGWTGNGLSIASPSKVFANIFETDFSDLANGWSGSSSRKTSALLFTTSTCGRFLLIARETLLYVYDICSGVGLQPLTCVICPRRVISTSMNASSGRYAVAALLEGRLGMVCELTDKKEFHTDVMPQNREEANPVTFNSIAVQANRDAIVVQDTVDEHARSQDWVNHTWNLVLRGVPTTKSRTESLTKRASKGLIPIETGASTFYRRLCSQDDPPRSVAICPQRRCVAFGCSSGIELHWVDAATGQSLTRWFPLTAPSDYLYFLAPRYDLESAKKLRLISSAAHPLERPAISRKFRSPCSTLIPLQDALEFERYNRHDNLGYDHYHAVPLSDGYHILFIDPTSAELFIGCNAPIGSPMKLIRKIRLAAPYKNMIPHVYTAASDLTWGARIVAVFGSSVVFYTVPPDGHDDWLNWWTGSSSGSGQAQVSDWPLTIQGSTIGTLRGICDIALFTYPELTVWAFSLDSKAKTWRVQNPTRAKCQLRNLVSEDGLVHSFDKKFEPSSTHETFLEAQLDTHVDPEDLAFEGSAGSDTRTTAFEVKHYPKALNIELDKDITSLTATDSALDGWYDVDGNVAILDNQRRRASSRRSVW